MEYRHDLSKEFVEALNRLYRSDEGGWWRGLLADPEIYVAFRDHGLNAYYRGCSVAQLRLKAGEVIASTHYKYLLRPTLENYMVEARNGAYHFPNSWAQEDRGPFTSSLSDLGAIKRAAKPYAGGEKKFVADLIRANANIFDVEIALTKDAEDDLPAGEGERSADRIDIAAIDASDRGLELVFFEAKLFQNKELRARGKANARVVGQIEKYVTLLARYRDEIRASCLRAAQNVLDLDGMTSLRKAQARMLLDARDRFTISTRPVLVVGGFDRDQRDGDVWKSHHAKLVAALKGRVIVAGNASSIRLGRPVPLEHRSSALRPVSGEREDPEDRHEPPAKIG